MPLDEKWPLGLQYTRKLVFQGVGSTLCPHLVIKHPEAFFEAPAVTGISQLFYTSMCFPLPEGLFSISMLP